MIGAKESSRLGASWYNPSEATYRQGPSPAINCCCCCCIEGCLPRSTPRDPLPRQRNPLRQQRVGSSMAGMQVHTAATIAKRLQLAVKSFTTENSKSGGMAA